jgi:hypothetical protein
VLTVFARVFAAALFLARPLFLLGFSAPKVVSALFYQARPS